MDSKRRHIGVVALAVPLAFAGCAPDFVEVSGRLTHKGQPVPSTMVKFFPTNGGRPGRGVTDDDGRFVLRYTKNQTGATPGPCSVAVEYWVSMEEELGQIKPKAGSELKKVIAGYGDPATSKLRYEITTDSPQVIDVDLP
jgi:hypothetical protein